MLNLFRPSPTAVAEPSTSSGVSALWGRLQEIAQVAAGFLDSHLISADQAAASSARETLSSVHRSLQAATETLEKIEDAKSNGISSPEKLKQNGEAFAASIKAAIDAQKSFSPEAKALVHSDCNARIAMHEFNQYALDLVRRAEQSLPGQFAAASRKPIFAEIRSRYVDEVHEAFTGANFSAKAGDLDPEVLLELADAVNQAFDAESPSTQALYDCSYKAYLADQRASSARRRSNANEEFVLGIRERIENDLMPIEQHLMGEEASIRRHFAALAQDLRELRASYKDRQRLSLAAKETPAAVLPGKEAITIDDHSAAGAAEPVAIAVEPALAAPARVPRVMRAPNPKPTELTISAPRSASVVGFPPGAGSAPSPAVIIAPVPATVVAAEGAPPGELVALVQPASVVPVAQAVFPGDDAAPVNAAPASSVALPPAAARSPRFLSMRGWSGKVAAGVALALVGVGALLYSSRNNGKEQLVAAPEAPAVTATDTTAQTTAEAPAITSAESAAELEVQPPSVTPEAEITRSADPAPLEVAAAPSAPVETSTPTPGEPPLSLAREDGPSFQIPAAVIDSAQRIFDQLKEFAALQRAAPIPHQSDELAESAPVIAADTSRPPETLVPTEPLGVESPAPRLGGLSSPLVFEHVAEAPPVLALGSQQSSIESQVAEATAPQRDRDVPSLGSLTSPFTIGNVPPAAHATVPAPLILPPGNMLQFGSLASDLVFGTEAEFAEFKPLVPAGRMGLGTLQSGAPTLQHVLPAPEGSIMPGVRINSGEGAIAAPVEFPQTSSGLGSFTSALEFTEPERVADALVSGASPSIGSLQSPLVLSENAREEGPQVVDSARPNHDQIFIGSLQSPFVFHEQPGLDDELDTVPERIRLGSLGSPMRTQPPRLALSEESFQTVSRPSDKK